MTQVEIYFDDLTSDKQVELLAAVGESTPEAMNWDTFPVAVFEFEGEDEKD